MIVKITDYHLNRNRINGVALELLEQGYTLDPLSRRSWVYVHVNSEKDVTWLVLKYSDFLVVTQKDAHLWQL